MQLLLAVLAFVTFTTSSFGPCRGLPLPPGSGGKHGDYSFTKRHDAVDRHFVDSVVCKDGLISQGLLVQPRPNVYILGTVHLGSESSRDATWLLETVQPTDVVLEMAPSRVTKMRQKRKQETNQVQGKHSSANLSKKTNDNLLSLFPTLLALAEKGWTEGGLAGFLFATVLMGGSLVQQRWTFARESDQMPPRVDEFAAALEAADAMHATVWPADVELDDLLRDVSSFSVDTWWRLASQWVGEVIGTRSKDPLARRCRGGQVEESIEDWMHRRRNVTTARESRRHGEKVAPELARVLVQDRDEHFARACEQAWKEFSSKNGSGRDPCIVCIGLVHLDGVAELLQRNHYCNESASAVSPK